ncbi:hypothetical protein GCM10008983_16170 [Lentibacillus halophilus]|uniref:Spo0E like sporulation regulatory protein n=1 Tax=Lentibacillus halophilus TaxID=295065 RepID=A0ABN0Z9C1_9BACI
MEILKMAITNKKEEMIKLGVTYGLTDQHTIICSQQLDTLLNLFDNLNQHNHDNYDEDLFRYNMLTQEGHISA